ncbi:MAG: hypothetical protein KJ626_15515 [Verrucomicrobia bacterium]|nr:hypothetical protein [Verrucomicrobiota bacterium]
MKWSRQVCVSALLAGLLILNAAGRTAVVEPVRATQGMDQKLIAAVHSNLVAVLKENPSLQVVVTDKSNPDPAGDEYYKTSLRYRKGETHVSLKITDANGKIIKPSRGVIRSMQGIKEVMKQLVHGKRRTPSATARPEPVMNGATMPFARVEWKDPNTQVVGQYEGGLKRGLPEGYGKLALVTGDRYEGEFNRGYMDGQGAYTWKSGVRFQGKLKEGLPDGEGVLRHPSGAGFEGWFVDGRRMGHGTLYYKSGAEFSGYWTNNVLDGYASYKLPGGRTYSYQFAQGKDVTDYNTSRKVQQSGLITFMKISSFVGNEAADHGNLDTAMTLGKINMGAATIHTINMFTEE